MIEFYHLVTRKPLTLGQQITFNEKKLNRLYDFFLAHLPRNADEQTISQVLQQTHTVADPVADWEFLQKARAHEVRVTRELITEMVRAQHFPQYPSRFACLYGTVVSLTDSYRWKQLFESFDRSVLQLVTVTSEGPVFFGDAELLPTVEDIAWTEKISQAYDYWNQPQTGGLGEVLIGGTIKVSGIIEDFQLIL